MSRARTTFICPPVRQQTTLALRGYGAQIRALEPFGAEVSGLNLRDPLDDEVRKALQDEISSRGFVCFRGQGVLAAEEQVKASTLWGGREIHTTHSNHFASPHPDIFRLSNDPLHGILDVGPQWHNDGSFLPHVFSHVGYHIVSVPSKGGNTEFSHLGGAYDRLSLGEQDRWSRIVSVNATSGVLHPLVHTHPILKRKVTFLHLGMTGAAIEMAPGIKKVTSIDDLSCLNKAELTSLMKRYNKLLSDTEITYSHQYQCGDLVIIDNLAVAHRASREAHVPAETQGLRILHRTTVKGMVHLAPDIKFALPPIIQGMNPFPNGQGVWVIGGLGFRWDESIKMRN